MKISELARRVGVIVETILYYQRTGLIDVPGRPLFGFSSYTEAHAASLSFIRRAQRLGFTLDEVAALLHLSTSD
jgi:MerR family mercuric resistance operon transcriptional regulator